jgi:hypothetical protein
MMRFFNIMAVLCVSMISVFLVPVSSVAAAPSTPNTPKCTIKGTNRSEVLRGTPRNDVICGFGGNDTIMGMGGNDIVMGGAGNDIIDGGVGNDLLLGDDGTDTLIGGVGNDALVGGIGRDRLNGGAGKNHCVIDGVDGVVGSCPIDQIAPQLSLVDWPQIPVVAGNTLRFTWSAFDSTGIVRTSAEIIGTNGQRADWCAPLPDNRVSGDEFTGIYAVNCVIPTTVTPQRYNVTLSAEDYFGNRITELFGSFLVTNRAVDNTAPQIGIVAIPEMEVMAGTTLTLNWDATDESGVASTYMNIGGPNGWITNWCGFGILGERVSGDEFAGTYRVNCAIPANAVNQRYDVYIGAQDNLGNSSQAQQISFRVVNGATDAEAPVISDLGATDTIRGAQSVIRWRAQDETAVRGAIAWVAYGDYNFADNTGRGYVSYGTGAILISGTAQDGIYEQKVTVRDDAPAGRYTLWMRAADTLGNSTLTQTKVEFMVR